MNRKHISILTSTVFGVLIASTVGTCNVKAAVKSYIVNDSGKYISFDSDKLISDYTNNMLGQASPMYDTYIKESKNLYALEDDKRGYVSYDYVNQEYINQLLQNKANSFNLDETAENAADNNIIKNLIVGYQCKDGNIVPVNSSSVAVEKISLNKTSSSLTVGQTDQLTADITPEDATNKEVTWKSSNDKVASVDSTGKVTATASGTAVITVETADGNQAASCNVTVSDNNDNSTVVTFKDKNFEQAVRDTINKQTGDIYKSDVEKITELDIQGKDVQNIGGIENLTNLNTLYLNGNPISDISPLSSMKNLRYLYLSGNQINNLTPLKDLTNLEVLGLSANPLKDISALSNLVNLKKLYLTGYITEDGTPIGQINDISALKGLVNLQYLDLKNNQISDVDSLKGLSKLEKLYLNSNPINNNNKQELELALPECYIEYK